MDKDLLLEQAAQEWRQRGMTLSKAEDELAEHVGLIENLMSEGDEFGDMEDFGRTNDRVHLTTEAYLERIPQEWKDRWAGREIDVLDWRPRKGFADDMDDRLRQFVLSCIPQFDQLCPYEEFYLYLEQDRRWREETKDKDIMQMTEDEAIVFVRQEQARMTVNSLYALNRWARIREDGHPEGRKYKAGAPQAYLCYFIDRGNDINLLKGRQAAITSTIMAVLCVRLLMMNNWTGVLLTDDKVKTGEDLFDKKVQGTLKLFPEWITQEFTWDRQSKDNVTLDFRDGNTKDERRKNFSDLLLLSSDDPQAVNSKTPSITAYDEVQNIETAMKIKSEVQPTQNQEIDGVLLRVRQQLMWGTGTSNKRAKGVWLKDWSALYKATKNGEPTDGRIVMFFDWTCRPGADKAWYLKQRAAAIRKYKYENAQDELNIFSTACPNSPEDAFMDSHSTVVPPAVLKKYRNLVESMPAELRPVKGWFEPIYDHGRPYTDDYADHKFYISGARFVKAETSRQMANAPVEMFLPPNNEWLDRNHQGTDPIQSVAGYSKFSSAIWDSVGYYYDGTGGPCCGTEHPHFHPTVACLITGRTSNPLEMYTQSVLMSLAYHNYGQRACRELVEYNQGQRYIEYKQLPWVDQRKSLVTRMELRDIYKRGKVSNPFGLYVMPDVKSTMLRDLEEIIYNHGRNIRQLTFWQQVSEIEVEEKDGRKHWGTRDTTQFNDDAVISVTLAKINADASYHKPRLVGGADAPKSVVKRVIVRKRTPFGTEIRYEDKAVEATYNR